MRFLKIVHFLNNAVSTVYLFINGLQLTNKTLVKQLKIILTPTSIFISFFHFFVSR